MLTQDTARPDFFVAGGTLRPNSPSYVRRPADDELFNLALGGKFCYVLTARQMGKSSLMTATARQLKAIGVRTAIIDLTIIGVVEIDQWYSGILTTLSEQLNLSIDVETWWTARASLGPAQRFTNFLRDVILKNIEGRIVVFVDEIDNTLKLNFTDDFFAAIRAVYNARANAPDFNRLTFVLLGVAMPADLIKDSRSTPFNIGQGIDLREFSYEDAKKFKSGLSYTCQEQVDVVFDRIFHWTNGHPYLTQKLCLACIEANGGDWNKQRVDELVNCLFLSEDASRKETNLQFVRTSIASEPQQRRSLLSLYRNVHLGKAVLEDERSLDQNRLKLLGLVQAEKGLLKVRNEIYKNVFDLDWIRRNIPIDWARRIAIVSTVLVILFASIAGFVIYRQGQQTAEAQAQLLIGSFQNTSSAEVRINSLAEMFRLGLEDRAKQLFQGLSPAEKLALFSLADPKTVGRQLIATVQGLYTEIPDDEQGNELLRTMAQPLRKLDDSTAAALATEIEQWRQGREYYASGDYQQAVRTYDVVIGLNARNPGTLFDRGVAYAAWGNRSQALADLETALKLNSSEEWRVRVQQVLIGDGQLYSTLWSEREKYPTLIQLVPTPTNTPVPTSTSSVPTRLPTATPTNTPTIPPATPSATPIPSTPTPIPIPTNRLPTTQANSLRNLRVISKSPGLIVFLVDYTYVGNDPTAIVQPIPRNMSGCAGDTPGAVTIMNYGDYLRYGDGTARLTLRYLGNTSCTFTGLYVWGCVNYRRESDGRGRCDSIGMDAQFDLGETLQLK